MRHLTVSEFGTFLGVTGNRLVVKESSGETWETPLSRLRSIRVAKNGVSLSSNLILACAARGIRIFFTDWRNVGVVEVGGTHRHAVAKVRKAQFACIDSLRARDLAAQILYSKVRNQRAVLLYFNKYQQKKQESGREYLQAAADELRGLSAQLLEVKSCDWRNALMGLEGMAARTYWQSLVDSGLLPESFSSREGRGSSEITNAALNYGYAILQSYVHSALDNAGLEVYAGLLHTFRPGKPSLVLDLMEEYRAWVVDRNVIVLRSQLESSGKGLTPDLKRAVVDAIDETMAGTVAWKGKQFRLENVLQRQVYRLVGSIAEEKSYRGIRFKW
jgi:CRISPR-associated protein Cas1